MRKTLICLFAVLLSLSLFFAGAAESGEGSFLDTFSGMGDIIYDEPADSYSGMGDIIYDEPANSYSGMGDIIYEEPTDSYSGMGDIILDEPIVSQGTTYYNYNYSYDPNLYYYSYPDQSTIIDPAIHVYMYVRTSGGHLNVRAWPDTNATIVGKLKYGEQILVTGYAENRTWAKVLYNGSTEYVLARYLSDSWPGPAPTATPAPYYPTSQPYITPYYPSNTPVPVYVTTINDLNTQFNSMVLQNPPVTVSTHPARVGGFVSLYWAPDPNSSVIRYCYEGESFTVLAYNNAWIQVRGNSDGTTGFLMRTFAY